MAFSRLTTALVLAATAIACASPAAAGGWRVIPVSAPVAFVPAPVGVGSCPARHMFYGSATYRRDIVVYQAPALYIGPCVIPSVVYATPAQVHVVVRRHAHIVKPHWRLHRDLHRFY